MSVILSDVYSLFELNFLANTSAKSSREPPKNAFPAIENLVLCESILVEHAQAQRHIGALLDIFKEILRPISASSPFLSPAAEGPIKPRAYQSRMTRILYEAAALQKNYLGDSASDSFKLDPRINFYLNLSQELGVYYAPHPIRLKVLGEMGHEFKDSPAMAVIKLFDKIMQEQLDTASLGIDVDLPPVVDHVIEVSRRTGASYAEAIEEVRNSINAKNFRDWCSIVADELTRSSGRAQAPLLQEIKNEIEAVAQKWAKDLADGVKHRRRKITLSKIWGLGPLLEAVGLDSYEVRDPILHADSRVGHLLFLNDLYGGGSEG